MEISDILAKEQVILDKTAMDNASIAVHFYKETVTYRNELYELIKSKEDELQGKISMPITSLRSEINTLKNIVEQLTIIINSHKFKGVR